MSTARRARDTDGFVTAKPVRCGVEDKFYYEIAPSCVSCGACERVCPAGAVGREGERYAIDPRRCIDCGFCSAACPTGAARPVQEVRESVRLSDIDMDKCFFNPGCAMSLYKPEVPQLILNLLRERFHGIEPHAVCCRHNPALPRGAVIINSCAGCDRRFRSLYEGIRTISLWEVLDGLPDLNLPRYDGMTVSVHDSCGYRHKPQVHRAVRSLLGKMNIKIEEARFSGTESVCCGDNCYGLVPNERVEERIRQRAGQFPCQNVVVYCIGCVRALYAGERVPLYLPDLLLNRGTEPMPDGVDEYHSKLEEFIVRR